MVNLLMNEIFKFNGHESNFEVVIQRIVQIGKFAAKNLEF